MIMQALIAIIADTVTYHVVVWQIAAGTLIAVAVFAGMWLSSPPEAPKRRRTNNSMDQEIIEDDLTADQVYNEFIKNI